MIKHCRFCMQDKPACLCNTCKHDSLMESPTCCSQMAKGKKTRCSITSCEKYEREDDVYEAVQNDA